MSDTLHARPTPKRPQWGLVAWQATIGYVCQEYNRDAMLTFRAYPVEGGVIGWGALASWANSQEGAEVRDLPSLAVALSELWVVVDHHYPGLLKTFEAASRRPSNYDDTEWLDPPTQALLDRLMQVTWTVFQMDWILAVFYQPIENPADRVHTRLIAKGGAVKIEGSGPALHEACSDLFRKAAQKYAAFAKGF
jgi:hypothetical protein